MILNVWYIWTVHLIEAKFILLLLSKNTFRLFVCLIRFCTPQSTFKLCPDRSCWVKPVLSKDHCFSSRTQCCDAGEAQSRTPYFKIAYSTNDMLSNKLYAIFRVDFHVVSFRIHCTEKCPTSFHNDVLSKSK